MSFSIGSSGSSSNPSLAWVIGNRGKGRMLIKFPLPLDKGWYHEQPCTTFHTLEHRKERSGFRHEFIVLKLLDGSVCRVERMGDPDARFEALSPRGTVAHDMVQCFRPDELDQACLDTSDTIVEIKLPCDFDLMDVLKVCRAIQEGEKTCNYTLQVFNCFFFSLAIQACLVRLLAYWESQELLRHWLTQIRTGVRTLRNTFESDIASNTHALHQIYSILTLGLKDLPPSFEREVRHKLRGRWKCPSLTEQRKRLACYVNKTLWQLDIRSGLEQFVEEEVRRAMTDVLKEMSTRTQSTRADLLLLLAELVTPLRAPSSVVGVTTKQRRLNRRESKSNTVVAELSFKRAQTSRTAEITLGWSQWISGGIIFMWYSILWILSFAFPLPLKVGSIQCGILDQKLGSIAKELEDWENIHQSRLEEIHLELKALVHSEPGVATWDRNPWATLCHLVTHNWSENMLGGVDSNQPMLTLCVEAQPVTSGVPVSDFQDHILARIKSHAELVQSVWLGSATTIEAELKRTLSQVWGLIREDDTLIKKETDGSSSSNPLVNSITSEGPSGDDKYGSMGAQGTETRSNNKNVGVGSFYGNDVDDDSKTQLRSHELDLDGTQERPMNAFMIFARKRRPMIPVLFGEPTMRTEDISKVLCKEWSEMGKEDKQFYVDQAKKLLGTFDTRWPDYVYRRRPSNVRKRRKIGGTSNVSPALGNEAANNFGGHADSASTEAS